MVPASTPRRLPALALPLLLLLLQPGRFFTHAGESDAGDAGSDGTADQGSIDVPDDGAECACRDDATWTSPTGQGPCAAYGVGQANEGYCADDGATLHCPKACNACPECLPQDREMSTMLLLAGVVAMGFCFGVPTAKYFIDIARFTRSQYRMWREAQDSKMKSLSTRNEVRKARGKFSEHTSNPIRM